MKNNFRIELKKEIYDKKTEEGGYIHPSREYSIEHWDEIYSLSIEDGIIGNNGGSYKAKLCFIKSNIDREKREIYQYEYNKNQETERIDKNFNDIVQYLLDNRIIKKIKPSKNLL